MEVEKGGVGSPSEPPRAVHLARAQLKIVDESLETLREFENDLEMICEAQNRHCFVRFFSASDKVYEVCVRSRLQAYQAHVAVVLLRVAEGSAVVTFNSVKDTGLLLEYLSAHLDEEQLKAQSVFSLRTEEASAKQYFQFYGYLSQQQNMMQDYLRTSTYQSAVLQNTTDFRDKVVLDVGAGTGVLSFFTLQGGARRVYAVEASSMARHCQKLANANNFSDRMVVIAKKMEEVELPEMVDVIISEPMGYMLFNERMLESYLHAKKWLKPGGKMYPTQGILYVAPFTDEALYMEQIGKTHFWNQQSFHGVDVSALQADALDEYFQQPIVDTFDIRILTARPVGHATDFSTAQEQDLHKIEVPLSFTNWTTGYVHGVAFWFDVAFIGSQSTVWLSTAPFQPLTHWYQVRLLLKYPLFVHEGQQLKGLVVMQANERQSYDISLSLDVVGTNQSTTGTYDLKNPIFRYMNAPLAPPGAQNVNPTETYFDSQSTITPHHSTGTPHHSTGTPHHSTGTPHHSTGTPHHSTSTLHHSTGTQQARQTIPQAIRAANGRGYLARALGAASDSAVVGRAQSPRPHHTHLPHTQSSRPLAGQRHSQLPHTAWGQAGRHGRYQQPRVQSIGLHSVPNSTPHMHTGSGYYDITAGLQAGHVHSNSPYLVGGTQSGAVLQKWLPL